MDRRRAARGTLMWGTTALAVFIAAVWVMSGWYALVLSAVVPLPDNEFPMRIRAGQVSNGRLVVRSFFLSDENAPPGWSMNWGRTLDGWSWGYSIVEYHGEHFYALPLWPLFLLAAVPACLLWRGEVMSRRRRRRAGDCPTCGYDRRGLASHAMPCPECGATPTAPPRG